MSETLLLRDLCQVITKGTTPTIAQGGFTETGVNYIKSESLTYEGSLNEKAFAFVSPSTHEQLKRSQIQDGDILYSIAGANLGKCAIATSRILPANTNQAVAIIRLNPRLADGRFVSYCLRDTRLVRQVLASVAQSAQPNVNLADVGRIEIPNWPLAKQRAVSAILGALDDKIENNRRINSTLESITGALFKSWFVDLNPVRLKVDGLTTHLTREVVGQFSDSPSESAYGQVPTGWRLAPVGQYLSRGVGGAWGEDHASAKAPLGVRCLRGIDCHQLASRRLPSTPERFLSEQQVASRVLRGGEIIVEGSGSFCGRSIYWLPQYATLFDRPVTYSNFCKRLDPTARASQSLIAWLHIRGAYEAGELNGYRVGTAFPNFDVDGLLDNLIVPMPPPELADAFAVIYGTLLRVDLLKQSQSLAKLRDALLPKLISGELLVSEADRTIEKSA
jgi:type I restriction enzyme S subunit